MHSLHTMDGRHLLLSALTFNFQFQFQLEKLNKKNEMEQHTHTQYVLRIILVFFNENKSVAGALHNRPVDLWSWKLHLSLRISLNGKFIFQAITKSYGTFASATRRLLYLHDR